MRKLVGSFLYLMFKKGKYHKPGIFKDGEKLRIGYGQFSGRYKDQWTFPVYHLEDDVNFVLDLMDELDELAAEPDETLNVHVH